MNQNHKEIIEFGEIRVVIEKFKEYTSETIEIKENEKWISLIGSNPHSSTLNFYSRNHRYSKPMKYRKRTKKKLYYLIDDDDITLNLDYCMEENNIVHIRYKISNKRNLNLSKILVNYRILLGADPDYTWVPHLRPEKNLVMGDHIYRSPVIVYKKSNLAVALIPDLKTLGRNRPFQTFMDLNLKPSEFQGSPQCNYGFGNYKPYNHIRFKHKPLKKWNIKKGTDLTFRYYVMIFRDKEVAEILEFINHFFWEKYGRKLFYESLEPQLIPYEENVQEGFKAIIERHQVWGEFQLNGKECGGFWQSSWMGKNKSKIQYTDPNEYSIEKQQKKNMTKLVGEESFLSRIIMYFSNSPFWIRQFDKITRKFGIIGRNAEIWNNAWFMNIRSGYAFRYFGEKWQDQELSEQGNKMLETILNLPRIRGVFPTIFMPAANGKDYSVVKGVRGFLYVDEYNIVDCSLGMYWTLKFYQDFEKREDILSLSKELVDLIKEIQFESGEVPPYINFKKDKKTPVIEEVLLGSASSGAPLMFLAEYYNITQQEELIPLMERIAGYIIEEIIPHDKWHDFEPFYSCTHLPTDFYDEYTDSHVMNGLCIYWCAEGLKELYKITKNEIYLQAGVRVMSVLALFQQVWNAPYINFHTFGGFASQNIDAEWSDARQGLFVRTFMEYYVITGKYEYMERGIAALRACWAMQLLPQYAEICPGNQEGLPTVAGIDKGAVTENYGHSGTDLRVPGYIMFDWGVGTSASATAYVKKYFGDLFIDAVHNFVFGIDGILMKSFDFENNLIKVECKILEGRNEIIINGLVPDGQKFNIIMNGKSIGEISSDSIKKGFIYKSY